MNQHNSISYSKDLSALDYPNISSVDSDESYLKSQSSSSMVWGLFALELIRRFEEALIKADGQGLLHGPLHSSIGQEAVAVGTALALLPKDKITSTHRAHHHFIAKALAYYLPPGSDLSSVATNVSVQTCVRKTMAEILGLSAGWIGGRGGSMHLRDEVSGNIGTQAIVGGNVPITSGAAFAEKFRKTGNVALAFLGDGAISIGPFHEGICLAKVFRLPAIFVIENNLYGVATHAGEATGLKDLVMRSSGYNIPGLIVDGMDTLAMRRAVELARAHAVAGEGPVMIEAKTYRYFHQSGGIKGSAFGYRTKEEEGHWSGRDPLQSWPQQLQQHGLINEEGLEKLKQDAGAIVQDAVDFCMDVQDNKPRLKRELVPTTVPLKLSVRSDGEEFEGLDFKAPENFPETREWKMSAAISGVLARRLETEPEAFIIGEDVANLRGGAYGATKEALVKFPARVLNSPIAEGGIVGLGHGAAMAGMKPIVELMFCDFALVAADELFNQVGTCRFMYEGQVEMPLIVRSRCSTGRGFGAQHSSDTAALFALYPGWRILAPTTPFDYIGLFNSAMRSLDPVLVLEHHELANIAGAVPLEDLDFLVPMGQAKIRRAGTRASVLVYLSMVPRLLRIAEELADSEGIDLEVIDLLSLDFASIDWPLIDRSVSKTGSLIIIEQSIATQTIGSHLAAQAQQRFAEHLQQPIVTLASLPTPMPVSKSLEKALLISDEEIREAIIKFVQQ